MLKQEWYNTNKPYEENGVIYYNYKSEYTTTGGALWNSRKVAAHNLGMRELLDFYNKIGDTLALVSKDENFDYYIDPRPNCGRVYFLISIKKDLLESLEDKDFIADEGLLFKEFTTLSLRKQTKKIIKLIKKYNKILKNKSMSSFGVKLDLSEEIKNLNSFLKTIDEIVVLNRVTVAKNEAIPIKIGFDENGNFSLLVINNIPATIGRTYYSKSKNVKSRFIRNILLNIERLYSISVSENNKKNPDKWTVFFGIIFGETFNINPQNSKFQNTLNAVDVITGGSLQNVAVPCMVKDFIDDKFEELIDNSNFTYGKDCGLITLDAPIKFKNKQIFLDENRLIDTSDLRIDLHSKLLGIREFVGDVRVKDFIDVGIDSSDLNDIYDKVLNYLSFDELLKKVTDCLPDIKDIKDVCLEIYAPLTITFPDTIKISGVFDVISDIVFKATLTLSAKVLITLLENFFDKLVECENGKLELYNFTNDSDTLFGSNASVVNKYISTRIYDNFDDMYNIRSFSVENDASIRKFLDLIAAVMTPQELCSLVRGNPSDKVKDVLDCVVIANPDFPNTETVVDIFTEIGILIDFPTLFLDIPDPTDNDPCLSEEQFDARRTLLMFKDGEISSEILDHQIEKAKEKLKKDVDFINSMVKNRDAGETIVFGGSIDKHIKDTVPTSRLNENLRSIIRNNIKSIYSPLINEFNLSLIGHSSLLKNVSSVDVSEIRNSVYDNPELFRNTDSSIFLGNNLEYSNLNSIKTLKFGPSVLSFESPTNQYDNYVNQILTTPSQIFTVLSIFSGPSVPSIDGPTGEFLDATQQLLEQLFAITFNTKIIALGKEYLQKELKDSITSSTPLFENSWPFGGIPVKEAILEDYLSNEEVSRKTNEYDTSLITGLISSYIKIKTVEFIMKNYNIISDFDGKELNDNFGQEYIKNNCAPLRKYTKNSRIQNFNDTVVAQMNISIEGFKDIYSQSISPKVGVINKFMRSLEILETQDVYNIFNTKGSFYIYKSENEYFLQNIFRKGSIRCDIKTLAVASTLEELIDSLQVKNVFENIFPLRELLSVITIYNLKLYEPSSYFRNLTECIEYMIDNLINGGSVEYDSENSSSNYNRKNTAVTKSSRDVRIDTIEDLGF
jgi:hypothetical protein